MKITHNYSQHSAMSKTSYNLLMRYDFCFKKRISKNLKSEDFSAALFKFKIMQIMQKNLKKRYY
jgi:hypothetical protein